MHPNAKWHLVEVLKANQPIHNTVEMNYQIDSLAIGAVAMVTEKPEHRA